MVSDFFFQLSNQVKSCLLHSSHARLECWPLTQGFLPLQRKLEGLIWSWSCAGLSGGAGWMKQENEQIKAGRESGEREGVQ